MSNRPFQLHSPSFRIDTPNQHSNLSIKQFFLLLLPSLFISKKKKTLKEINLYYSYLFYLEDFVKMIQSINPIKYKNILFAIASFLCFEKWEADRLLMRIGDKGEKFYLILQGSVNVLILKERICVLNDKDYYRYIAFLIGYQEYNIVSRVINDNAEKYALNIIDVPYGRITKNLPQGIIPIEMTLNDLLKYLTEDERKIVKEGFENSTSAYTPIEIENKLKNTHLTTQEYIDRIKPVEIEEPIEKAIERYPRAIEVVIVEYIYITSLITGQKFGDRALSDPYSKRTATILTSGQCYFGILNIKSYNASLKEVTDQINKEVLKLILSTYVFKNISTELLLKKYFNYFVQENVKKGAIILLQREISDRVIIAKEGEYKITAIVSMKTLSKMINNIFSAIKKPSYEYTEEEYYLAKTILEMNKEDKMLNNRFGDITMMKFLNAKEEIHISSFKAQDVIGLSDCYKKNYKALFSYKVISNEGEFYSIKREFYNQMKLNDPSIQVLEREYEVQKRIKMLSRLLNLRKAKLQLYFQYYPDSVYSAEYCVNKKYDTYSDSLINTKSTREQFNKKVYQTIISNTDFTKYCSSNCFKVKRRNAMKNTEKCLYQTLDYRNQLTLSKRRNSLVGNLKHINVNSKPGDCINSKTNNNAVQGTKNNKINIPHMNITRSVDHLMPLLINKGISNSNRNGKSRNRNPNETITLRQLTTERYPNTQFDSSIKTSFCFGMSNMNNYDENFTAKNIYQMPFEEQIESQLNVIASMQKSQMKKSSSAIGILNYIVEKKEHYINNNTKQILKRTRDMMIFKHKTAIALVKKS